MSEPCTAHVLPLSNGVSGRPVRTSLPWIPKNSPQSTDCFCDKKAIKTPKHNIIWLELIARVLNMLIGLKGNNYYSKVFKRVYYKLSNSTFWVVIIMTDHIRCRLWWKPDRTTMWLIVQIRSKLKTKLSCCDRKDWVWFVTKTKWDNDVTSRISLVYVETEIELSGPIWPGVVSDEN